MAERSLRVVIAPDSFGGSLDSATAAEAIAEGWSRARPGDEVRTIPMADGGEGTLAAVAAALGPAAERRTAVVADPRGRAVDAAWLLLDGGTTALIEMATASGLALVPPPERTPVNAAAGSSRGTGELMRAALDAGARRIVLGLGGSATSDGGAGMLAALGVRLLDADAKRLPPGGAALARLARIDIGGIDARLPRVELVVASDVTNPLSGPSGAAAVYGPQKGADPDTVARLDAALAAFGSALEAATGRSVADLPGAGAAGGTGAALLACTGATLRPGFAVVAELVGLEAALADADLVITGEGRVDAQTLAGKAARGVAEMAAARGTPTVLLCGALGPGHEAVVASGAFALVQPIPPGPMALSEAMADARRLLASAAERLARAIGTGMVLVGGDQPRSPRPCTDMIRPVPKPPARRRGPSPQKLAADRRARRARAELVLERLGERYHHPRWGGPRLDAPSELVLTILSQNTADTNSFRAFTALRERYRDWDAVLAAPTDELVEVIRPGGLAPTKAPRIQRVLAEVHAATGGTWDLGFLGTLPLERARQWLIDLPGIGRKTAAIILLFNFGRPALPVDTHVHRVALRLGLIPPKTDVTRAHDLLEGALRDDEMYPFHVELIRHGRDTCRAPRPICGLCPLTDLCPYFERVQRGKAPVAPVPRSLAFEGEPRYHDELIHGWAPPEARDSSRD